MTNKQGGGDFASVIGLTVVGVVFLCAVCYDPSKPTYREQSAFWSDSLGYLCDTESAWYADHNDRCDCNIPKGWTGHSNREDKLCPDCRTDCRGNTDKLFRQWNNTHNPDNLLKPYKR